MGDKVDDIKKLVREGYGKFARQGSSCCSSGGCCSSSHAAKDISKTVGYSDEEMSAVPDGSNLGLGCGNPVANGSSIIKIIFDVSTGLPREGATFDIMTASYLNSMMSGWDADYEITAGQVVIHTADSGRYSYEIKDLTLVKTKDYDSPGFAGCDVPDIVIIESISATCDPEINKGRSC